MLLGCYPFWFRILAVGLRNVVILSRFALLYVRLSRKPLCMDLALLFLLMLSWFFVLLSIVTAFLGLVLLMGL